MRPIEFRGKTLGGDIVCGDLIHDEHNKLYIGCIVRNEFLKEEVEPESVAQLVGYDEDGNEVYEGDVIQTPDGQDYLIDDLGLSTVVFVSTGKLKK